MTKAIDQKAVAAELERSLLAGLDGKQRDDGARLATELAADWAREANSDPDPPAVLEVQRADLDAAVSGKTPQQRLDVLRAQVVERKINRASVATWALGTGVVDGKIAGDAARAEGQKLLAQIDALTADVKTLADADTSKRLMRDLNEARMEALYAVERKAMSLRLNRYQQDHPAPAKH
ncbi:MAG TPA: hypothetical protein VFF06_20500 [Polyangia bacterium]|nr:hypothetical protein [Polyangia bacterium]